MISMISITEYIYTAGFHAQVEDAMLLVDVMFPELSVLRASKIRRSGEGGKFVNLSEKTKPGDVITVRIENIGASKRKGAEGENLDSFLCAPPPPPLFTHTVHSKGCVLSFTRRARNVTATNVGCAVRGVVARASPDKPPRFRRSSRDDSRQVAQPFLSCVSFFRLL